MAPDRGQLSTTQSSRAWEALTPPLSQWILEATASMSFPKMTPVQASTIPLFLGHKDVVVEAVTGSGKTLAFLIPLVERILRSEEITKKHHIAAIVISPTRELAVQIYNVLSSLLAFHGPSFAAMKVSKKTLQYDPEDEASSEDDATEAFPADTARVLPQLLVGGGDTPAQDLSKFLKTSPNVLVSTPGRLLEILSSPYVHAPQSSFEVLVLDEADRLLDLGFKDDLTKILSLLPKQRRTGLFSASVSEAVDQIIRVGLRNPVRIAVKVKGLNGVQDKKTPASLKMTYLVTSAAQKLSAVKSILQGIQPRPLRTIIYLSTCAAVDYFQHLLPSVLPTDMSLVPLHGKQPSNVREKNFRKFVDSASPAVLITTDVAARGLDVPSVDLVIQVDPPSDPKVFIHRCGRAGRAGRKGLSVVFLQPGSEQDYISFLDVRKTPLEELKNPSVDMSDEIASDLTQKLRKVVLQDRAIHDKAQKAFVSWVRSYSKHQASSIFRISELDWNDLVQGWALLRFPKMPEAKKYDRSLIQLPAMDWDKYAYKDKTREQQRRQAMQTKVESPADVDSHLIGDKKRTTGSAWSEKAEQKADRDVKRTKREARRSYVRSTKMTDAEKMQESETRRMIEQIRVQQLSNKGGNDDFEGFD